MLATPVAANFTLHLRPQLASQRSSNDDRTSLSGPPIDEPRQSAHGRCSCPRGRRVAGRECYRPTPGRLCNAGRCGAAWRVGLTNPRTRQRLRPEFVRAHPRCWWELTFSQWRSSLCEHWCGPSQARRSDAHNTKSAPRQASTPAQSFAGAAAGPTTRGVQSTQKFVLQFPYCDWRQKD